MKKVLFALLLFLVSFGDYANTETTVLSGTGTLVWAQIANAAGAQTMSITLAAHEYIK